MKKLKLPSNLLILFIILAIAGCAPNNKLKDADKYKHQKNYVPAIMLYDKFIERNPYSAEGTVAEINRSESYYQLGLQAYTKKNWKLAERLFFLANSAEADKLADDVHLQLANIAAAENDIDTQLRHYNLVINYIPDSELIPQMLIKRMAIYLSRNQNISAYADYKLLWDKYPMSDEADTATAMIDPLMPWFLSNPRHSRKAGNYAAAIAEFQIFANYPSQMQPDIYSEMAETFIDWALQDKADKDYISFREHLIEAIELDGSLDIEVQELLESTCDEFIAMGNELLENGESKAALVEYEKCFVLLPQYAPAVSRISFAREQKARFDQADSLYAQAEELFSLNKHEQAKKAYKRSWELSGNPQAKKMSDEMDNYIRAQKDPAAFALEIIKDYHKGSIKNKVDRQLNSLVEEYGDQVTSSDWKVSYSYGEFNFEVRIDIFTPRESYYYAWRINLIERSVVPLNKASEGMMK